jgi:signal transduction histidine kinase
MMLDASNVILALLFAGIGGAVAWLLTTPLRRRSIAGLLSSVIVTASATTAAAVVGSVRGMLLPAHEHVATLVIITVTAVVATAAAIAAVRKISADSDVLREAIADVGEGRVPTDDRRLSGELEHARRELQAAAAALAEGRRREQALESSRRQLVSWVSHDLRTPLAGLRAIAEALEDGVAEDPTLYYKQMHESVIRLTRMVDDLFDLSRIQAGAIQVDNDRVPLSDLVSDAVAALQPLAAASHVHLSGAIQATPVVVANPHELTRAVTNLMANAIRHTEDGGGVEVLVAVVNGQAEVRVRDACGGIDAKHLERLFEVGYRASAARTVDGPNPAGAGLGLAITKGIVEAHGGSVDVMNNPPGCVFRVRLPLASDASPALVSSATVE